MGRTSTRPNLDDSNIGVNPFEATLEVRVNRGYKKDTKDGQTIKEEFSWEYDPFMRIYEIKGYKASMMALPIRSKEMLLYLFHSVPSGSDWLWIDRKDYMTKTGIKSVNTYTKALGVLCMNGYIARHSKTDVYWINPQIFFKGSRINKFSHKIKVMNNK